MADFLIDTIEHSWGKSPKQKAREKEYNHWYYIHNKNKWNRTANNIKIHNRYDGVSNQAGVVKYSKNTLKYFEDEAKNYRDMQKNWEKWGDADEAARYAKKAVEYERTYNDMKRKNQEGANKRINYAAAANEMQKARTNAEKQAQKYEMLSEGKDPYGSEASRTVKHLIATAKNTINEGMDFIRNLFK